LTGFAVLRPVMAAEPANFSANATRHRVQSNAKPAKRRLRETLSAQQKAMEGN